MCDDTAAGTAGVRRNDDAMIFVRDVPAGARAGDALAFLGSQGEAGGVIVIPPACLAWCDEEGDRADFVALSPRGDLCTAVYEVPIADLRSSDGMPGDAELAAMLRLASDELPRLLSP